MNTKAFNPTEYRRFDATGKQAIIKFFKEKYNKDVRINPDKMGVDLLVGNTNNQTIDVQVRRTWKRGREFFPYPDIHVPVRNFAKSSNQKILMDGNKPMWKEVYNMPTYYCILREDLQKAIFFKRDDIINCRIDNTYVPEMSGTDSFFCVPQSKGKYVNLV